MLRAAILEASGDRGADREPDVLVTEEEEARRVVSVGATERGFELSAEDDPRLREMDGGIMSLSWD